MFHYAAVVLGFHFTLLRVNTIYVSFFVYLTAFSQLKKLYGVDGKGDSELIRIWKEAVVTYFKLLYQHFPIETE
jgi:hypothetical protein